MTLTLPNGDSLIVTNQNDITFCCNSAKNCYEIDEITLTDLQLTIVKAAQQLVEEFAELM